jgi:hypothetical protein
VQYGSTQLVDDVQLGSSNFLVVQKDPKKNSSSAAVSTNNDNVTKCEEVTSTEVDLLQPLEPSKRVKQYDSVLGINPPEEWKNLQQKQFDWVPDGPWLSHGKLDPNFVDWLARDWLKEYGGTIHKKRSDVLRHFKKDAGNIAIAWEQYRGEHLHRYENAAVRMHNGLEIQPDEQQQLLTHARAVTNPLPDELNPVASAVEAPTEPLSNVPVFLPQEPESESASRVGLASVEHYELVREGIFSEETQLRAQPENHEDNSFPIRKSAGGDRAIIGNRQGKSIETIPADDDGCTENPDAYKEWRQESIRDEVISPIRWQQKLAAFTQELSMSKNQPEQQKSMESLDELEELNQWLCDPILCKEVMARVMRSERMRVEFDEDGNPYKVLEIRD